MKQVLTILAALSACLVLQVTSRAASVDEAGFLLSLTPPQASSTDVAELDDIGFGNDGFILFNVAEEGENLNARPFEENLVNSAPAYVGTLTGGPFTTSSGGWANYDDVSLGGEVFNTGGAAVRGGDGLESEVLNFEIAGTPPSSITIGIIVDNQDGLTWTPSALRVAVGESSSASVETPADLGTDLYLFQVDNSVSGDIVQVFLTEQEGNGGAGGLIGGLTFDSVAVAIDADFDDDGSIDTRDIDILVTEIAAGTNDPTLDLDGDGAVSDGDLTLWLSQAGEANIGAGISYLLGDANIDGNVNATDLNALAINWQGEASWSGGDFTADGAVGAADLNLLGINWQESVLAAPLASSVPEPASGIVLVVLLSLFGIKRSRRK
jgi:hypothetical protein